MGLGLLACESSLVDPVEIQTIERTAIFDGVQVRLTALNTSWMPREGAVPAFDTRLVTFEVEVLSYSLESRSIRPGEFWYRTWDSLRSYEVLNTAVWLSSPGGREPALESIELENGETFRGWLTFRVPAGPSYRPDGFLWRPDPRVSFSFHLPLTTPSLVCGYTHIFGNVTDPQWSPVAGSPVELSFFNLDRERNSFEQGECSGEVTSLVSTTTNEEGHYEHFGVARFCTERCVELTAFGPDGSGPTTVTVTGGTIVPSAQNMIAEAPELRIDAVLPLGEQ